MHITYAQYTYSVRTVRIRTIRTCLAYLVLSCWAPKAVIFLIRKLFTVLTHLLVPTNTNTHAHSIKMTTFTLKTCTVFLTNVANFKPKHDKKPTKTKPKGKFGKKTKTAEEFQTWGYIFCLLTQTEKKCSDYYLVVGGLFGLRKTRPIN